MFRSRKGAKSCFAEPISCFKESKVNHPRTPPLPAIFSTLSGCLSSPGKLGKGLGEPGELAMWQVNAWWNSLNHRIIFGVRTAETQQKTSGRGKCCSVNILKFRKTFASLLLQILQELYACWYLDTFCKNYSIKPKFEKKNKTKGCWKFESSHLKQIQKICQLCNPMPTPPSTAGCCHPTNVRLQEGALRHALRQQGLATVLEKVITPWEW